MCGIAGFIGQGTLEDLKDMNNTLAHRGPDAEGYWYDRDRGVYLAHKRLSIIDLTDGVQPMWTVDGQLGIIFNGEIYNYLELKEELKKSGCIFITDHSDTEVLLHGYKIWGTTLVEKLNGMWAFAIYDRDKNILFCSRDRFGKKPFFYTLQNGTFAFASELNALIKHTHIQAKISLKNLKKYFAYGYIPAPNSLYERIYKLPGGNNLFLDINSLNYEINKYWDFIIEPFEKIPKNPVEEWGEEIRHLLKKAVKRRLVSDVPLGVFLSGGIDSSSVTAYVGQCTGYDKLKTFSIGFKEVSFDESIYAMNIASHFNTEHHMEILSIEKAKTLLPEIAGKLDEPMGDSSLLPTYLLCKETRKYVTVAIGGDGADELFAGYDPFKALMLSELYDAFVPKPIHKAIKLIIYSFPTCHNNMSLDFKLKRTIRGLSYPKKLWNPVWLGPLEPEELGELFSESIDIEDIYSEAIEHWDTCKQKNLIDKTLQFYTKLYLQDDILVKVDRASMMNSLEVRAPYLDIDLVNFVRQIPYQFKFHNGKTKYILKKALEPVLPHDTIYRSKKGFGIPIGKWFKDGSLFINTSNNSSKLNKNFYLKLYEKHKNGFQDNRSFLWNHWLLEKI